MKCDGCGKTALEANVDKMKKCSKCKSAPYCSAACQKKDYPNHKQICGDFSKRMLAEMEAAERPVDGRSQYISRCYGSGRVEANSLEQFEHRTVRHEELRKWAEVHNGTTLILAGWMALELLTDIERRKSHTLILVVSRTKSKVPVTFYEMVEAQVIDAKQLKHMFRSMSYSPRVALREWETEFQKTKGGIGSMMVVTFEQMPGTKLTVAHLLAGLDANIDPKPATITHQPLGVFEQNRKSLTAIPSGMAKQLWKPSLKNALDGGAFTYTFQKMPESYFQAIV